MLSYAISLADSCYLMLFAWQIQAKSQVNVAISGAERELEFE